jgi:hypothetical protein
MARLIGYGAYNLCFDRDLALYQGVDLFQFIRNGGWPVNLVKVICFRRASLEGLPLVPDPRTIPVYTSTGAINQAFLQNLGKLVARARQFGFTVQLCLFSYHSIGRNEGPEYLPDVLKQRPMTNKCQYLKYFFNPSSEVLAEQIKLVKAIANQLKYTNNLSNVIWEISNEQRIDLCDASDNRASNCRMTLWFSSIAQAIRETVGSSATGTIITSTGHYTDAPADVPDGGANEAVTFSNRRPVDGCSNPPFVASLFDLHGGQWEAPFGDYNKALSSGIANRFYYGYGISNGKFIINTDGVHDNLRTPQNIEAWATAAFRNHHHFATKQYYPPDAHNYDIPVLDALKRANAAVP